MEIRNVVDFLKRIIYFFYVFKKLNLFRENVVLKNFL